ncbi:MAG: DinB family protein [Gemmatimonadetes bacterium]|nr:DinB family protein [Gemmatimonadota bacterium]
MSSASTSLLEEALQAWGYARDGVVDEVQNLPADRFEFRPTPANRSVAELVQHIVESGYLMVGELTNPKGDFRRKSYDKLIAEHAPQEVYTTTAKRELVKLLKASYAEGVKRFREGGELLLLQFIRQFNGVPATRLTWMHHGIGHEEYHRGQLALYARLLGRVPALTKMIMGG